MPELSGLNALDVAIGMVFLFVLLSTICASINELIAGVFGWRAQELEKALGKLLAPKNAQAGVVQNTVKAFFESPRIAPLVDHDRNLKRDGKTPTKRRRSPSYVPAGAFARVALGTFNPNLPAKPGGGLAPDAINTAKQAAAQLPDGMVRQAVLDALDEGRASIDEVRQEVERTFDQVMDRCAGWYKRRTQKFLFWIALLVTVGLNVDSFHVADRLMKDDALRAAVVVKAGAAATKETEAAPVAQQVDRVRELGLPIGWGGQDPTVGGVVKRVPGWMLTILAIMLGAPFWFDVLGKFAKLRSTGNREGTLKDDSRAAEDRDDPTRVRPAPVG